MPLQEDRVRRLDLVPPEVVLLYTRHWIHYGSIGFVVFVTTIAAIRGFAGL